MMLVLPPQQSSISHKTFSPSSRVLPPIFHSARQTLPPRRQPAMPSQIERLPMELQEMVFGNLDYQSLILLSTTNRYFHKTIKPRERADPKDMFQFVMEAARSFPQHRPKKEEDNTGWGNFECYVCYRVRAHDHFDTQQRSTAYFDSKFRLVSGRAPGPGDVEYPLRRFCIDCGVKEGLHEPLDSLTTRRGNELWVCHCRRVWSKPGYIRCPHCKADCPLRPQARWSPY